MAGSFPFSNKFLKALWTAFCITITAAVAISQIQVYLENKDVTHISYNIFHQNEKDVYPNIGFCFSNVVIGEKLKKYGDKAIGNKIIEYINMLNFVVLTPDVMGSMGILAFSST